MSWHVRAGLLMYRFRGGELEVFLARRGTPPGSDARKNDWVLPKGGQKPYETLLQAAEREFEEEVGIQPRGPYTDLGSIQQKNGKMVHVWAFAGNWDDAMTIRSPKHEMVWPPGSGRTMLVAEFDEGRFFSVAEARKKLNKKYRPLLDHLLSALSPKA